MTPEVLKFIDYFQSFYGKNGLYDIGSTREEAMEATLIYLTAPGALTFEGDSFDRENVRDVLLSRRRRAGQRLLNGHRSSEVAL